MAQFIYQKKIDGKWTTTWECENDAQVYADLTHELIAKKLEHCTYIRSITRKQNYNGTKTITISYTSECGGGRRIYTIEDH